jgi:hypothetical protein
MPMIAQMCHHPCCSQVEKSCGCLPSPRRSIRRRFRAAVTTHIVLSWKKLWGVCLATTKSTLQMISHAFVLYRELVTELSHYDLENKFTERIALICPSLPPTDN